MANTTPSTVTTARLLTDACIARCRGGPDTPALPTVQLEPGEPVPNLETVTEWAANYGALIKRFQKRRDAASPPDQLFYAICADRIAAMLVYLNKIEERPQEPCWSEVRPFLRSSSQQDREMGADAKHNLFFDAQKLWTLDAMLQEEEVEIEQGKANQGQSAALVGWKSMSTMSTQSIIEGILTAIPGMLANMSYRCSKELIESKPGEFPSYETVNATPIQQPVDQATKPNVPASGKSARSVSVHQAAKTSVPALGKSVRSV